jgi:two-component system LytT family response regulator
VPVDQIVSITADGELLHLHTVNQGRHTITFRLKDLEARLAPARFVRLGRGTIANVEAILKVNAMPGGTHVALMSNGQKLHISRIESRKLRTRLFKL